MSETSVLTARLDKQLADRVDLLAQRIDRSRTWVIAKAIQRYVDEELAFMDFLQEGIDSADRGELYSQEEMVAWFADKLGRRMAAE